VRGVRIRLDDLAVHADALRWAVPLLVLEIAAVQLLQRGEVHVAAKGILNG
jgi:hypothetical protein